MAEQSSKAFVCHFCGAQTCGLIADIVDNKLTGVRGNPRFPYGMVCGRGFLNDHGKPSVEFHYHENRINFPLKRAGERGEGKWKRITWEEALDEVATRLKKLAEESGPESLSICKGTAHMTDYQWSSARFATLFQTPNYTGNEQICYGPEVVSDELSFGWPIGITPRVMPRLLVLGGIDRSESIPAHWSTILQWITRGVKVIAIDPRMTESVRNSHVWLQVRPGSDIALLLAWLNVIVKENLYDHDFVVNRTNAPFLVRVDKEEGRLLRGTDILASGRFEDFVVWNARKEAPSMWNPGAMTFEPQETEPALTGSFDIRLASGDVANCKTVWQLLSERVAPHTPGWAENLTWVRADRIAETARMYATTRPAIFLAGHCYESFAPGSGDIFRLKNILTAVCGHVGTEGAAETISGPYYPDRIVHEYELELKPDENMPEHQKRKQIGADRFRVFGFPGYDLKTKYQKEVWGVGTKWASSCEAHGPMLWRSILSGKPYPVRAVIVTGANPLDKFGNTKMVYDALKKLDLLVVLDMFETPTAALADYVFPMTDCIERPSFNAWTLSPVVMVGERAMKPEFERRDDYDFWRGLGVRLGQEKYWSWKTLEDVYDYRVQRGGGFKSFADMARERPVDAMQPSETKFATPSRRVEIYTTVYETLGYDPLPSYKEPTISPISTPILTKEYPLILVTVLRHLPYYHSEFYMIPSLRKLHPDPIMEIHPHTARKLNPPITDGDWVWIETRRGRIRQRARLTWGIDPRVVSAQHCWWFPEKPGSEPSLHGVWESNINVCTEDDPASCDPVFGTWPLTSLLCKVYKA